MIGVVMRVDQVSKRLVGYPSDGGDHRFGVHRRSQRIDHHHVILADDNPGIADADVVSAGPAGLDIGVNIWGYFRESVFQVGTWGKSRFGCGSGGTGVALVVCASNVFDHV